MKVTSSPQEDLYKEHENNLSKLNKELARKISSRENEIKQVEKHYDNKMSAVKKNHDIEYERTLDQNQQKMLSTAGQFEEKIQTYKDKLSKIQSAISEEEKYVKSGHREKMDNLAANLEEDLNLKKEASSLHYQEIQAKTKESIATVTEKSRDERISVERDNHERMNAFNLEQSERLALNRKRQSDILKQNNLKHQQALQEQEIANKEQMAKELKSNLNLKNEMNRVGVENINFQNQYNQSRLMQLEEDFQVRYQEMSKKHQETLKTLGDNFNVDLQRAIQKSSQKKMVIAGKEQDPFYNISTLNPKVVENPKEVIVSLPVADYEKDQVRLSTNDRQIKITLARKFDNKMDSEDGGHNRSTRSELFSKEFTVTDILNPKGITQKYEDGILSFKIFKA